MHAGRDEGSWPCWLSACSLPLDIRLEGATPVHHSSTHLRRPLSLAGWLMAVKSTISVRACTHLYTCIVTASGASLGLRRRVCAGAVRVL